MAFLISSRATSKSPASGTSGKLRKRNIIQAFDAFFLPAILHNRRPGFGPKRCLGICHIPCRPKFADHSAETAVRCNPHVGLPSRMTMPITLLSGIGIVFYIIKHLFCYFATMFAKHGRGILAALPVPTVPIRNS